MNNDSTKTQGEIDTLTDGERAVLEQDAADQAAAAKAAAEAEAAKAAEEEAAKAAEAKANDPPPAPLVPESVPALVAPPIAPVAPPLVISVPEELAARDFDKERAELKAKWEEGDVEQADYDARRDAITAAETQRQVLDALSKQSQAHAQQTQAQLQAQTFEQMSLALLRQPENADLADPTRNTLFQAVIDRVDKETGGQLDNATLLAKALASFRAVVPSTVVPPPPPPPRVPDASTLPPRIAAAPAAVPTGTSYQDVDSLAALAIEDVEAALMSKSPEQIEQILSRTPGSQAIVEARRRTDA